MKAKAAKAPRKSAAKSVNRRGTSPDATSKTKLKAAAAAPVSAPAPSAPVAKTAAKAKKRTAKIAKAAAVPKTIAQQAKPKPAAKKTIPQAAPTAPSSKPKPAGAKTIAKASPAAVSPKSKPGPVKAVTQPPLVAASPKPKPTAVKTTAAVPPAAALAKAKAATPNKNIVPVSPTAASPKPKPALVKTIAQAPPAAISPKPKSAPVKAVAPGSPTRTPSKAKPASVKTLVQVPPAVVSFKPRPAAVKAIAPAPPAAASPKTKAASVKAIAPLPPVGTSLQPKPTAIKAVAQVPSALASPKPKAASIKTVTEVPPTAILPKSKPVSKIAKPAKLAKPIPAAVQKVAETKRPSKTMGLKIPPILMEGDVPAAPSISGPGQRYALGPARVVEPVVFDGGGELPESYGTQQLSLTARDPHWLYAYWDFSRDQLNKYNALSTDGHLLLRIYGGASEDEPVSQIHLHPDSRTWFAPVPTAGAKYMAELGYYDASRQWVVLARSGPTFSPPDDLSQDTSIRFATIPPEVPFRELVERVKESIQEHAPLIEAVQQMREQGRPDLPAPETVQAEWTPEQEKALAEVIAVDSVRRMWLGPLEITELIRREILHHNSAASCIAELAGLAASSNPAQVFSSLALAGIPGVPNVSSLSHVSQASNVSDVSNITSPSGGGGAKGKRGFWFKVNAELVIYGATEPDAQATLAGRPIKLRPDGSFSFRFSLPDGTYSLEAAARASDGQEARRVDLNFHRQTDYQGEVGAHPQDESLRPPTAQPC